MVKDAFENAQQSSPSEYEDEPALPDARRRTLYRVRTVI
jgi:hypothetical protein